MTAKELAGVKFRVYSQECGKWQYATERRAREDIQSVKEHRKNRKNRKRSLPTAAYICPICGWWHITSQPQIPGHRNKSRRRVT